MTHVTADQGSVGRRDLLRGSVRHRVSSLVLVGATWVTLAVSIVVHGPRHLMLPVVGFFVVGAAVLWGAWRPAVFVEDDRLVVRNLFYKRVLPREEVRGFRVTRRSARVVSVWAVTARGAVAINTAERPRFMPYVRDLDADVAALNTWLAGSDQRSSPSVSYLPDNQQSKPSDHQRPPGGGPH